MMPSSGMLRRVALVRPHVSEELIASVITVTGICELGTLPVPSNRRRCEDFRNVDSYKNHTAFINYVPQNENVCVEERYSSTISVPGAR
jgi:hypothetical protein